MSVATRLFQLRALWIVSSSLYIHKKITQTILKYVMAGSCISRGPVIVGIYRMHL